MTAYSADQVRSWTVDDLARLDGELIDLRIDGQNVRGGVVASAHPGLGPTTVIEFVGGGSWTWATEATDAEIVVHDDAGARR